MKARCYEVVEKFYDLVFPFLLKKDTDLSNPTSNSIYQKIGYRPVIDENHYKFISK